MGKGAFEATGLNGVVIPSTLKAIPSRAFNDCEHMTALIIPEGVETVGAHAFANTFIRRIDLPSTIVKLGKSAFMPLYDNDSMHVTLPASQVELGEHVFGDDAVYALEDGGTTGVKLVLHCYQGSSLDEKYVNPHLVEKRYLEAE